MITPRLAFSAAALALFGCGASAPPPPPPAPSASAAPIEAPAPIETPGAVKVDDEPAPGQSAADPGAGGGSGPSQAAVIAETKRLRDSARGCVKEAGALLTGRVHITIAPSGRASSVKVKGHLGGTPEGGCVATAFRGFHVAPFVGSPVTVKMSISLP